MHTHTHTYIGPLREARAANGHLAEDFLVVVGQVIGGVCVCRWWGWLVCLCLRVFTSFLVTRPAISRSRGGGGGLTHCWMYVCVCVCMRVYIYCGKERRRKEYARFLKHSS